MILVTGTNKRKGISMRKQSQSCWLGLRKIYAEKYKKCWELERNSTRVF